MSGFFRVFALLIAIAIAVGIGAAVYNAGVTAGLAEAARQAAAGGDVVPLPYAYGYGPYWHGPFGIGFFGIIFWILGFFLIVGLVRAAFGWGRWRGGPPGGRWSGDRHGRVEEWHRELHRREGAEQPQGSSGA
jgi:hypothetical protein